MKHETRLTIIKQVQKPPEFILLEFILLEFILPEFILPDIILSDTDVAGIIHLIETHASRRNWMRRFTADIQNR